MSFSFGIPIIMMGNDKWGNCVLENYCQLCKTEKGEKLEKVYIEL